MTITFMVCFGLFCGFGGAAAMALAAARLAGNYDAGTDRIYANEMRRQEMAEPYGSRQERR